MAGQGDRTVLGDFISKVDRQVRGVRILQYHLSPLLETNYPI